MLFINAGFPNQFLISLNGKIGWLQTSMTSTSICSCSMMVHCGSLRRLVRNAFLSNTTSMLSGFAHTWPRNWETEQHRTLVHILWGWTNQMSPRNKYNFSCCITSFTLCSARADFESFPRGIAVSMGLGSIPEKRSIHHNSALALVSKDH